MPRLLRDLAGAEPVDQSGSSIGATVTLRAGTEFTINVGKLKRPSDDLETWWCEIQVDTDLYRLPLRSLDRAKAA